MKKIIILVCSIIFGIMLLTGCKKEEDQFAEPVKGDTVAEIVIRDYGSIYVRFFDEAAPKAVENFTTHAKNGYYDGLTFHRILEDFMIQGGDPKGDGSGGESIWGENFKDEFSADLQPYRGALCMANSGPDTNGSQFFLVQASKTYTEEILNQIEEKYDINFDTKARAIYGEVGGTPWLYKLHTVFGQIYDGYEVLDAVAKVEKTDEENGIPATEVIIEKINIFEY
jgi:peptidyl-prolyl cis-trans isomerase B (cyclophilin B)